MTMVSDRYFFLQVYSVMVKYNYSADSACIEQGLVQAKPVLTSVCAWSWICVGI